MLTLADMWSLGNVLCPVVRDIRGRSIDRNELTPRNIVNVDGIVEYKSLPSGLHNVSEDLVYEKPLSWI